jgi:hypothetical protein
VFIISVHMPHKFGPFQMNVDVAEYPAPQNVIIAPGAFDTADGSLKSKSRKKK